MKNPRDNVESPSGLDDLLSKVPNISYGIVACWPHDPAAFTQGLVFHDNTFYESTGIDPEHRSISTLRQVEIGTGRPLRLRKISKYFAEGLAVIPPKIFQLTYDTNVGFVYDLENFNLLQTFGYKREGWGLTNDGHHLIMSNGSSCLQLIDPRTLKVKRGVIEVKIGDVPLQGLNELEYINGSIYANVFMTDYVVSIDPSDGSVEGRMNFGPLRPPETWNRPQCVLNGIAYNSESEHLFVTGKNWPRLFEIRLLSGAS